MGLSSVLSTAATGLAAASTRIRFTANNVANAQTDGFKQSFPTFATQPPSGTTGDNQVGNGVAVSGSVTDFSQGAIVPSSGPFDLALQGEGFFVVQGSDGQQLFTRSGQFQLNAQRQLVTATGERLLGRNSGSGKLQPLTIPEVGQPFQSNGSLATVQSVQIGRDGAVQARLSDGTTTQVGQVSLARFNNPSGLLAQGRNLYAINDAAGAPTFATPGSGGAAEIVPSAVEASNTDVGQNLISSVLAKTQFRANLAVIETADDLLDELFQIGRR